jgi:hypothetical protein
MLTETFETLKLFKYQGSGVLADPRGFLPSLWFAKNYASFRLRCGTLPVKTNSIKNHQATIHTFKLLATEISRKAQKTCPKPLALS